MIKVKVARALFEGIDEILVIEREEVSENMRTKEKIGNFQENAYYSNTRIFNHLTASRECDRNFAYDGEEGVLNGWWRN